MMKTQTNSHDEDFNINGDGYTKNEDFSLHSFDLPGNAVRKTILARDGDAYVPLLISKIALFTSTRKTVTAIDFDGNKYIVDKPLSDIEMMVGTKYFFRVNRNVILHFAAIKMFHIISFGKIKVKLLNTDWLNEEVQISQYMAPKFREWISGI